MSKEVMAGYKLTDVGVIPDDWEVKPLKRLSPSQSVGLVINPSSYFDDSGTVPMLVGSHIHENGINYESANRISEYSNNLLPASRLSTRDIVTVRVGYPGVTAVIPPELDGCNCASMMIVRQHHSFLSLWLCYVMNSRIGRSQIENVQYGTAQKQFNISDAVNFLYPVPPLPEQQAIASVLSDTDALIASLDKLIAKKRDIKQAAMQQLLTGKQRLEGFGDRSSGKFKQTEVGMIPEDWDIVSLGSVCEICGRIGFRGYTKADILNNTNGAITISPSNISDNKTDFTNCTYISLFKYEESPEIKIYNEDILLVKTGSTYGKTAIVKNLNEKATINPQLVVLKKITSDNFFLGYLMMFETIQNQISTTIVGGALPTLSQSSVRKFLIPLPPLTEQQAIAKVLSDMDSDISALEQRRDKIKAIKQAMMQELLTGRVRLIDNRQ